MLLICCPFDGRRPKVSLIDVVKVHPRLSGTGLVADAQNVGGALLEAYKYELLTVIINPPKLLSNLWPQNFIEFTSQYSLQMLTNDIQNVFNTVR